MGSIIDDDYKAHMAGVVEEGFVLDPAGYERLSMWTHMLMHLVNARTNFEWVRDQPVELGDLENSLRQQAFLTAGVMAYCRCYASSGAKIPTLDAKQVYAGSKDGQDVHARLIKLRNTVAFSVRNLKHTRNITHCRTGCHSTKCHDVCDTFCTVLIGTILNHLVTTGILNVDIDVGHTNTIWVQETLEKEVVLEWVKLGNTNRI